MQEQQCDHRSLDTVVSGNTNPETMLRGRAFQFTIHQLPKYTAILNHMTNLKSCDYGISCREVCPTTGKKHIHLYVHFTQPYRMPAKILALNQHIEICRGSPKQNIDYIKKDGDIMDQWGEEPHQGKAYTVKDLRETDIEEIPAILYNIKNKIDEEKEVDIDVDDLAKDVTVYYIQGPSGLGKTEKAKEIIRTLPNKKLNMIKYKNGFYLGLGKAPTALYDDFRDEHMEASEFINLIDYNKHMMNKKGGCQINKYSTIIITSVQRIDELYSNMKGEPRQQWMRRVKVIDMYEPTVPDEALT